MRTFQNFPGDERLASFYGDGSPARARALLLRFLEEELPGLLRDVAAGEPAVKAEAGRRAFGWTLFFVRAAETRPALRRVYEEVALAASEEQLRGLVPILRHVGDAATASVLATLADRYGLDPAGLGLRPDPRVAGVRGPIAEPAQVMLRWIEFVATGDVGRVIEVVGVLAGADRFRGHLEALLRPATRLTARFSGEQDRLAPIVAGLVPLGLRFVPQSHEIKNPDDLDVLIVSAGVEVETARLEAAVAALPAPLPDALRVHVETKAAALASLAEMAGRHAAVLAVCEAAADKLSGAVRLTLLRVLVEAHATRGELPAARGAMRRLLEGNRVREDLRVRAAALLAGAAERGKEPGS